MTSTIALIEPEEQARIDAKAVADEYRETIHKLIADLLNAKCGWPSDLELAASTELTTLLQRCEKAEALEDYYKLELEGVDNAKRHLQKILGDEGELRWKWLNLAAQKLVERAEKAEAAPQVELTDGTYVPLASLIHANHQVKELTRERDDALKALQAVDATAAFNTDLGKYMIEPHALDMVSNAIRAGGKIIMPVYDIHYWKARAEKAEAWAKTAEAALHTALRLGLADEYGADGVEAETEIEAALAAGGKP